jgi:hypothetical protein
MPVTSQSITTASDAASHLAHDGTGYSRLARLAAEGNHRNKRGTASARPGCRAPPPSARRLSLVAIPFTVVSGNGRHAWSVWVS